jgi:hypothetical protein
MQRDTQRSPEVPSGKDNLVGVIRYPRCRHLPQNPREQRDAMFPGDLRPISGDNPRRDCKIYFTRPDAL